MHLRRLSAVTLVAALAAAGAGHVYAARHVRDNEQAVLNSRASDVALVASQLISRLETTYVSMHPGGRSHRRR